MKLAIDLNTRIITRETRIWIVHPGTRRRFYNTFRDDGIVFLEYPSLGLTDEILRDPGKLRQRIRYSSALAFANSAGRDTRDILPDQYPEAPDTDVTTPLRTIRHLFGAAKRGDLIIVPGNGAYSATLFGELVSEFDPQDLVQVARYEGPLHVRRVSWLSTDRLRNELPVELAKLFEKPPAVAEVHRNDSTDRFFDYAFRSYVKGEEGWSLISANSYNGKDPRALIAPDKLIVLSVAIYNAAQKHIDLGQYSIDEIIDKFYSTNEIDDFSSRFTSPGKYGFKAAAAGLAIFVTISVAAFTDDNLHNSDDKVVTVSLHNSAGGGEQDMKGAEESLNFALKSMNPKALKDAGALGAQAKKDVNLKSDATVMAAN